MPGTFDVVSTREFPVPPTEAWRAWQDPDYLKKWWGPTGFSCSIAEVDFRVGGSTLLCMRAPAEYGMPDMYTTWTYLRIEPTSLIEFDHAFTDAVGARVEGPPGVPSRVRHIVCITPVESGTSVSITELGYTDEQARNQSQSGLEQCLDKMAELLTNAALRQKGGSACPQPSST